MSHKRHGRRKPYTVIGIGRVGCFRCGERARFQWQVCADKRLFRPLCEACDVALNQMVLRWMRDPDAKAKCKAYRQKARADVPAN